MKTFYLFKINNMFKTINKSNSNSLYRIINKIYNAKNDNYSYYSNLYKRMHNSFNIELINNCLTQKYNDEFYYYKKSDNLHIIDNAYEKSILFLNKSYIKIVSNNSYNTFLEELMNLNIDAFVIDFDNKKYFWLKELKRPIILK